MSQIRSSYTDSINFYEGHSPLDLAQQFGTPLYVYNEAVLRQRCRELKALSSLPGFGVNYSVKANTNPVLLRIIREEGLVVDAMSPGELYMDRLAGFTADEILYISNNPFPGGDPGPRQPRRQGHGALQPRHRCGPSRQGRHGRQGDKIRRFAGTAGRPVRHPEET